MANEGYFRFPTIHGSNVVFVSEDDLWHVSAEGGVARRLTSGLGDIVTPRFSPDGSLLAFTSREEQHPEVFCMPSQGGPATRITFLGANSIIRGWTNDDRIIFASDTAQPFVFRIVELFTVSPDGDLPQRLPHGRASEIAFGPNGGIVIGRNTGDPARWKRYRGGTAGHLWVDAKGSGTFRRILGNVNTNISSPMWIGSRIYFIADHDGIGNLYSCRPDGKDLRRHTDHTEYYARYASTDGRRIVYQSAGELFIYDPASDETRPIEVDFLSPRTQRNRKFVKSDKYLSDFYLHPKGHSISVEARGKAFSAPLWEEAPRQYGKRDGVRYRFGQWLHDGETFVALSDEDDEERIEVYRQDAPGRVAKLDLDVGRPIWVVPSPTKKQLAISNHRHELVLVDVDKKTAEVIDRSDYQKIHSPDWSPDGRWIAYGFASTAHSSSIKLADAQTRKTYRVTSTSFTDLYPSFDPEGKYLYFLSYRGFNPVYDQVYFDLSFPRAIKPMLVTLQKELPSPFIPKPKGFGESPDTESEKPEKEKEKADKTQESKPEPVRIDLDGIESRILAFPVPEGQYTQIRGIKGKALFTARDPEGSLSETWWFDEQPKGRLEVFDFAEQKHETLVSGISYFKLSGDRSALVYRAGPRLRALKAGDKPDEKAEDTPGRKNGWIDLNRIKVSVNPVHEWNQMLREAWRLMRDHFWVEEMSGVDWALVFKRYQVLIDKVGSRHEFSDLIWEMQGELGTSHAYEFGGDYREPPAYSMGHLAADIAYNKKRDQFYFSHIVRGDSWDPAQSSPLAAPGIDVKEGDVILAIGGQEVGNDVQPQQLLVNQADNELELLVADAKLRNPRRVVVKALKNEAPARYREWVERNRALVHERTGGRVGYVHIPDMGPWGYSEFHRYYQSEIEGEGLIVDLRFNGGGHVSQLILEKLARKRIGYFLPRRGAPEPYPHDSVLGPIVAITNELSGSDGDIASHCVKLMNIGPLVGKRTWGGVIGITINHRLADGSITTQPEFSHWFRDVGFGLENYGTDPDYDVDIAPHDFAAGKDPQMEKALDLVLRSLKKQPARVPEFSEKPFRGLPELPPRIKD